jgi:acylphosphatase
MAAGAAAAGPGAKAVVRVGFEVFGKVQGVFFRKFTAEHATALGLAGFVLNTDSGSVKGEMEGARDKVALMRHWLEHTGSPKSRIDRAAFTPEVEVADGKRKYKDFQVIR